MGLFDLFKRKNTSSTNGHTSKQGGASPKATSENQTRSNNNQSDSSIEIVSVNEGSHGDHFGGLLGFDYFYNGGGKQFASEMIALASMQKAKVENPVVRIQEASMPETNKLSLYVIASNSGKEKQVISAYPYLPTNYVLPFETKKIVEWSHIGGMEAVIYGGGRDTFGLSFFATDYAVNKSRYKKEAHLSVRVSGICMVLDKSDLTEINGQKISDDFSAYMPSKDVPSPGYFDFIGVLNDFQPCRLFDNNEGYLINVKLITHESDPNFFTIDLFVNKENMRIQELSKGMRVTGAFWLQGEIAS